VNGDGTQWHNGDIAAVSQLGFAHLCLPKAETRAGLDAMLKVVPENIGILALIETALGLENAMIIATHPRVSQLAFGEADFYADLGVAPSHALTSFALARLAVSSRAAFKPKPLAGPTFLYRDLDILSADCMLAKSCGAGGKLCIHPLQVEAVKGMFSPSDEEISWARRVIAAGSDGRVSALDGNMIDRPIVERARMILRSVE
jgi:citrate lyase subunit beta/citryl-CoA lyase